MSMVKRTKHQTFEINMLLNSKDTGNILEQCTVQRSFFPKTELTCMQSQENPIFT